MTKSAATRTKARLFDSRTCRVFAIAATLVACSSGFEQALAPDPSLGPEITQPSITNATVTVDATVQHQEMQGFGSSLRLFTDPHLIGNSGNIENSLQIEPADQNTVLDMVYDTIGLSRVRPIFQSIGLESAPGAPLRTDWIFADGHIALVKEAKLRGLREWWLSPVNLEPWMSKTVVSEYVDWAMEIMRYWRAQGVELTWYSVANEPSLAQVGLSGEFIRDAVKLLGARMSAEGFKTRLVIPDDVSPSSAATDARIVLSDPEARQYVGAVASHLYREPHSTMSNLASVAAEFGVPIWMSEFYVADPSPMAWAEIVHDMITNYNVSAVDYLWGFFGDWDPAQLISVHQASGKFTGATITPAGYAMAQYARFVLPGAKRVEATSSNPDVAATAFVRDGKIVIVALNQSSGSQSVRFAVQGLDGINTVRLVRTSASDKLSQVGHLLVKNATFSVDLPAQSISTLVQ